MQRVGLTATLIDTNAGLSETCTVTDGDDGSVLFRFSASNPLLHITLATHGDLSTRSLRFTIGALATALLSVVEYVASEEMLNVALEQFNLEYGIKR
jgi:hypothetical protein